MNVVKLCRVKFIGLFLVSTLIACGHGVQPNMVSVARKPVPVHTIQQQKVNGKLDFVVCTAPSLCEKPTEKIIKNSEE